MLANVTARAVNDVEGQQMSAVPCQLLGPAV